MLMFWNKTKSDRALWAGLVLSFFAVACSKGIRDVDRYRTGVEQPDPKRKIDPQRVTGVERVIAVVGTTPIFYSDIEKETKTVLQPLLAAEPSTAVAKRDALRKNVFRQVLERNIELEMATQFASSQGWAITDDELSQWIEETRKKNGVATQQEFEEILRKQFGMTFAEYRDRTRREFTFQRVSALMLGQRVVVTDDDLMRMYLRGKDRDGVEVFVNRILVDIPPGAMESVKNEKREKLKRAQREIENGKRFQDVASEYGEDQTSKEGGQVGWMEAGSLDPIIRKKMGSQTGLEFFEMRNNFQLVQVSQTRPKQYPAFKDVKEGLRADVMAERLAALKPYFTEKLREQIPIRILEGDE